LTALMLAAGREPTQFSLGAGRRRVTRFDPQYPTTLDLARALIARGAGIDKRSKAGLTPLMLAAAKDQVPVVGLLVQSGADAKLVSPAGKTALDIAVANGNHQSAALLRLLEGGQTGSGSN
jgi:ankyrin repeat protein